MKITPTISPSRRFKVLLATALLGALSASLVTGARATERPQPAAATVKYADLDLATAPGAAALYERIRFAARELCAPLAHGDLPSRMHRDDCVAASVQRAVLKVNQPALTAVYAARSQYLPGHGTLIAQQQ